MAALRNSRFSLSLEPLFSYLNALFRGPEPMVFSVLLT